MLGSRGCPKTTAGPEGVISERGEDLGGVVWSRRGYCGVTWQFGGAEAALRLMAEGGNRSAHESRRIRQQEMTQ